MEFKDQSQEIKKALLQGGLVVADRGSGKTKALIEILLEDDDSIVIVGNQAQSEIIADALLEKGMPYVDIKKRVISALYAEKFLIGQRSNKNVYVDEWSINPYRGYFKGAVTSFGFPVKVIKGE